MLTDDQVIEQCSLIKKMLEMSSYFDGCNVECKANNDVCTTFVIASRYFIQVNYRNNGLHDYQVGYYKRYIDDAPYLNRVYLNNGQRCSSFIKACVRIVSWVYEDELQITFPHVTIGD